MTFPMAKEMADMIRILTGDETRIAQYGSAFAVHRFTGRCWVNVGVTEWEIQESGPEKKGIYVLNSLFHKISLTFLLTPVRESTTLRQ